jgi:integrase
MTQEPKSKRKRKPWNKGQLIGSKLPLALKNIRAIRSRLTLESRLRDLVLFNLAFDSALRAGDLLQFRVRDICIGQRVATDIKISQTATSRAVQFELSDETRESVAAWIAQENLKPGDYLFPSRISESPHILERQYARIVASWVRQIGLDPAIYGTESLRRTKPMLIYQRTKSLETAQVLLGHARPRSTARFLGVEDKS